METYILKASAILTLFLLVYQILLKNETFLTLNRFFLLSGLFASLLLPFVTYTQEVYIQATPLNTMAGAEQVQARDPAVLSWSNMLFWTYVTGLIICSFTVIRQLLGILFMIRRSKPIVQGSYRLIPSRYIQGPFSFFRYIFYNPEEHGEAEFELILEHEKAHGTQLHSLDILMARITSIILWLNPLAWWYQKLVQQNLEYLADARAVKAVPSLREYQYALLKVSGNQPIPTLGSPFNQSLIKKRIVMLQRNQSNSIHLAKYVLILPILALFLMAFNRETVYIPLDPGTQDLFIYQDKIFEVVIDKNTTDQELSKMKEKLRKDNVDFSYTAVRNDAGEIIDISFDFKGEAENGNPFSGSYSSDSDQPIKPIMIKINSAGGIYFGEVGALNEVDLDKDIHFNTVSGASTVWVQKSGDDDKEVIEIREINGNNIFIVDGEEVAKEEMDKVYLRQLGGKEGKMIKVIKEADSEVIIVNGEEVHSGELHEAGGTKKVVIKILEDGESVDSDVQIHKIRISSDGAEEEIIENSPAGVTTSKYRTVVIDTEKSGDYSGTHIISTDGKQPLYVIDGKKSKQKEVSKLDPDQIESINVIKGDAAVAKYGAKAKDGVVEIRTKKE